MCTSLPHVENEARENFSTEDIIMILQMILSEEEIYALANECHVCLRIRKFDVRVFIVAAIKCFLNGKQDIALRLLKVLYLEDSDTSISYTAIQNQLAKDSFADFIKREFQNQAQSWQGGPRATFHQFSLRVERLKLAL